jgi:hypothetical protein
MYETNESIEKYDLSVTVQCDEEGREQVVRVEEQLPVIE